MNWCVEGCYIVYRLLPPSKAKVMFSSLLVCLYVCLSVCLFVFSLSVRNKTDRRVNGFSRNFQYTSDIRQGTDPGHFDDDVFNPMGWICYFLDTCLLATLRGTGEPIFTVHILGDGFMTNITGKWINGFSWNSQHRCVMTQGTNRNILKMLC